jgi:hypothetical protein
LKLQLEIRRPEELKVFNALKLSVEVLIEVLLKVLVNVAADILTELKVLLMAIHY